jgi:hypothetical protein
MRIVDADVSAWMAAVLLTMGVAVLRAHGLLVVPYKNPGRLAARDPRALLDLAGNLGPGYGGDWEWSPLNGPGHHAAADSRATLTPLHQMVIPPPRSGQPDDPGSPHRAGRRHGGHALRRATAGTAPPLPDGAAAPASVRRAPRRPYPWRLARVVLGADGRRGRGSHHHTGRLPR